MTISVLEAHIMRAPAIRNMRMMDSAQSTVYSTLTVEGKRSLWNGWSRTISQITHMMRSIDNPISTSLITWNGEVVDFDGLRKKFFGTFGRRAVE